MKWISQDIEQYLSAQEYIDTAVLPLVPVAFGAEMKRSASMSEFLTVVAAYLERQFTGRILLLPSFSYLKKSDDLEKGLSGLVEWISAIKQNQFKHIFLLTCDSEWKLYENELKESLIWIPVLSLENFEESQKFAIVESQVEQIFDIFSRKWQENV